MDPFSFLSYRRGVPVSKAAGVANPAPYSTEADWVLAVADKASPAVRAAFLQAVSALAQTVPDKLLQEMVARGDLASVLTLLNVESTLDKILRGGFTSLLADVIGSAGSAALGGLPPRVFVGPKPQAAVLDGMFNIRNPRVPRFLDDYHASMVRGISQDTGRGISSIVQRAFEEGGHPRAQARKIRDLIGLLPGQEASLARYVATLTEAGRPAAQVERMAERYRKELLTSRAETIARTETIRAANAGAEMAWQEAEDAGYLTTGQKRRWVVTKDDRLCPHCAAIPGMNKGGVLLNQPFQSPKGPVTAPPLHPRCRCAVSLVVSL